MMKSIFQRSISALVLAAVLAGGSSVTLACGPYVLSPVFSLTTHPDLPLSDFVAKSPGIVAQSFDAEYLYMFYRRMNGAALTPREQKLVIAAMENGLFYRRGANDPTALKDSEEPDFLAAWLTARARVTGETRTVETSQRIADQYNYFVNCLPDAFRRASETLAARLDKHGNGEHVREWIAGQDVVFSNCADPAEIPKELGAGAPEWLRQDRNYQIAAARFYRREYDQAREMFLAIAGDSSSPWRSTARFVATRSLLRKASLMEYGSAPDEEAARLELYRTTLEELERIHKDPAMAEFKQSAARLIGLIRFRTTPADRRRELAARLVTADENPNFYNDLTDYAWLIGSLASQAEERGTKIEAEEAEKAGKQFDYNYVLKLRDVPESDRSDDLTDWMITFRAADGFEHALDRWKATGKTHWLAAAMVSADPDSAAAADLVGAALAIPTDSPAFATVRHHAIRLLLGSGKNAEAKARLDETLRRPELLSRSSQNRFLAQRASLATSLAEYLTFAQRKAVIFDWDETGREEGIDPKGDKFIAQWADRTMFDMDAVAFLNEQVPLAMLREAALSKELPAHLRKFLTIAVWTRAFALGDQAVMTEFAPILSRSAPEFASGIKAFTAGAGASREAAAMLLVLKNPVIQPYVPIGFGREDSEPQLIDSIRGNWWCAEDGSRKKSGAYDAWAFSYPANYPKFLTAAQTASAERERKSIARYGDGATFLVRRAIEFATANPAHPSAPEILHLGVRATRYGCTDDQTGRYSKQAFDLLHKKYPRSTWAKQTPYWFGK